MQDADRFYSQDAKDNREGYYVTATRFIANVVKPAITQMSIEVLKTGHNQLSAHEKANLKKIIMEFSMIALAVLAYNGFDEDDDESLMQRYILRRQIAELTFFMLPPEAIKIVSTPTASIGTVKRIVQAFAQLTDPTEEYTQGKHKGRNKLGVTLLKATPIFSQTEKDIKSSLSFLNSISAF